MTGLQMTQRQIDAVAFEQVQFIRQHGKLTSLKIQETEPLTKRHKPRIILVLACLTFSKSVVSSFLIGTNGARL